jgi:hypothetical protein
MFLREVFCRMWMRMQCGWTQQLAALVCTVSVYCVPHTVGSMRFEVPMAVNIRAGVPGCLGDLYFVRWCLVCWMLLFVGLLAPRILRWLLGCWKMRGLLHQVTLVWAMRLVVWQMGTAASQEHSVTSQKMIGARLEVVPNNTTLSYCRRIACSNHCSIFCCCSFLPPCLLV